MFHTDLCHAKTNGTTRFLGKMSTLVKVGFARSADPEFQLEFKISAPGALRLLKRSIKLPGARHDTSEQPRFRE